MSKKSLIKLTNTSFSVRYLAIAARPPYDFFYRFCLGGKARGQVDERTPPAQFFASKFHLLGSREVLVVED